MKSTSEFFSESNMWIMKTWWERLDAEREALGWSGTELARRTGIPYARINKYLNGKIEQPRGKVLEQLASAIGKTTFWLRDGAEVHDSTASKSASAQTLAAVVGKAEAGSFREIDDFDQSEPVYVEVPVDDRFPKARQLIFDVSGDSMNDLKPRPIFDGDRVVGLSYEDIENQITLRDGMVVVVERSRDGGHFREWSVKQLVIKQGQTEFHPRSTNSRHKPIIVSHDMYADDGVKVEIIAVVRRIMNELPL